MSGSESILRNTKKTKEILGFSAVESQQVTSGKKLILTAFEIAELNLKPKEFLLFMRVGKLDGGLYTRFRENVWYESDDYQLEGITLTFGNYTEHTDVWTWLERRINPLAITIATLISAIVTMFGITIHSYVVGDQQNTKIEQLQAEVKSMQLSRKVDTQ